MRYIDLRSDTVTQPTRAMREAMANAPVGDDVYGDDPTVNELERLAAERLNKEAALFVASGTMGNQLCVMAQTRRGDEVIVGDESHVFVHEVGAAAVLSAVTLRQLHFENGMFDAKEIERAIRTEDIHEPPTTLICMENALSNGRVVPLSTMAEVYAAAKKHDLRVHLDGARLFNAAVALGVDAKEITRYADTVSCCLSKGLCAPVGSVIAGDRAFIERARKYRKMLGGGMRQAGILAAAGILALTDMTGRLIIDHENAKYMARELNKLPGVTADANAVDINMVFFHVERERAVLEAVQETMLKEGVKINGEWEGNFRFVTSNDVSRADIDTAIAALSRAIGC
ncbi:MAG TPA: low-specificity L-threonine aldolase [Feifaniaceae bacterium]|nr:low-specificity L-threonine aldolase [Feifaniaceae bacterium]